MGRVDFCSADNRSVLEHVFKIYKVAVVHVLCKIVCVVEMNESVFVCLNDVFVKKEAFCDVL